jgi:transposase
VVVNKAAAPKLMSAVQRQALTVPAPSSTAAHRQAQRAKGLLMAADGVANSQIAAKVGVTPVTVRAWRTRFAQEGLVKFSLVRGGRGRKPEITPEQ